MRRIPKRLKLQTSFGTMLEPLDLDDKIFKLKESYKTQIDTPIQELAGTKKQFLKDSVVTGSVWLEVDSKHKRTRKVLMVVDGDSRYLIPLKNLEETNQSQIDSDNRIQDLESKLEAVEQSSLEKLDKVEVKTEEFLEKDFAGFKVKQLLLITAGIIVAVKILK
jgi:hypothetical protein